MKWFNEYAYMNILAGFVGFKADVLCRYNDTTTTMKKKSVTFR